MISVENNLFGTVDISASNVGELRKRVLQQYADDVIMGKTSGGTKFCVRIRDSYAIDFIFGDQAKEFFCEPFTTRLGINILKKNGGSVISAGAHIGGLAIPFSDYASSIYCFEPDPFSYRLLSLNLFLNSIENVCMYEMGLSDSGHEGVLIGEDASSHMIKVGDETGTIKCDTLDNTLNIDDLSLIQLDAEGSERLILMGANKTINKHRPFIISEIHMEYDNFDSGIEHSDTYKIFKEFGYCVYAVRDFNTCANVSENAPIELLTSSNIITDGPPHGFNLLAVPDEYSQDSLHEFGVKLVDKKMSPKLIPSKGELEFSTYYS